MSIIQSKINKSNFNRPIILLFITSLFWLGLNSISLSIYPTVTSDESLVGLVAYRQTTTGQQYPVSEYDPFGVYPFRLYLVGLTHFFNVFGSGLLQARAFSLLAGYISGWLIFLLARQLYDATIGVFAAALFWFSTHVFWASHYVRPEMWVTVANLVGLIAGWKLIRQPTVWLAALVGFLTVAILDVYLSTFSITIIVGALVVGWSVYQRRWSILTAFVIGCSIGGLYYLFVQFFPDWKNALSDWQQWITITRRTSQQGEWVWVDRLTTLFNPITENFIRYSLVGWLELLYWVIATTWLIKRRSQQDIYVLGGGAIALGIYALVFAGGYHALDAWPMPVMMIAAGLVDLSRALSKRVAAQIPSQFTPTRLAGILIAPLLMSYIILSAYYSWANRNYDYAGYTHQLAQLSNPQAAILGEGAWWWGFTTQPYWWDETLEVRKQLSLNEARQQVANIIAGHKIATVFLDNNLGAMPEPSGNVTMRQALKEYLAMHCELQGQVKGIAYGIDFGGPGEKTTQVYTCPID